MTEIGSVLLEKFFKCEGRRYVLDGRLFLNPSGACLKGLFRGERLEITLRGDPAVQGRNTYIRLSLDGHARRFRLPRREKVISLSAVKGEHFFEIVKLTESESNAFSIFSIRTDGEFLPIREEKKLKIEFVGDSITTGYGVRAKNSDEDYSVATQDVTLSYAYLAARALNAEMHVVAASGWGLYKSKYAEHAMPDFYDCVDLTRNRAKWDFSLFSPDVIVLALGTNDFSYLADLAKEDRDCELVALREHFVAFTRRLLGQGASVVLLYGFSGSDKQRDLPALIEKVWRAVDSPRLHALQVPDAHGINDISAGHPGKRTHRLAARYLTRLIRSIDD